MKKIILMLPVMLFFLTTTLSGSDFVTINVLFPIATPNGGNSSTLNNPLGSAYGTVNGKSVIISGTSSQPNMMIVLSLNGTQINAPYVNNDGYDNYSTYTDGYDTYIYTDGYGNWQSPSYFLGNGTYTLTTSLITPSLETIALNTATLTVDDTNFIYINTPAGGSSVFTNPIVLSGSASLANAIINISLDGNLVVTTSTDNNGNWQASYTPVATNGTHTFLVELVESDYSGYTTLASETVDINITVPIIFPNGRNQVSVIAGLIPASGSGSGPGYTYTISGSVATINFTPAFRSIPSVNATGLRSSGSSTVTVTSITQTATSIAFSTGTQYINFTAAIFS